MKTKTIVTFCVQHRFPELNGWHWSPHDVVDTFTKADNKAKMQEIIHGKNNVRVLRIVQTTTTEVI